jgi:hypothetical protein
MSHAPDDLTIDHEGGQTAGLASGRDPAVGTAGCSRGEGREGTPKHGMNLRACPPDGVRRHLKDAGPDDEPLVLPMANGPQIVKVTEVLLTTLK